MNAAQQTEPATAGTAGPADPAVPAAPRRRRRLRRFVLVSLVVVTLLLGGGAIASAYYIDSVTAPSLLNFPETTTLYYSDGSVLAELGDVRRTEVPFDELLPEVRQAAVAADDPDFWTDSGGPIARSVVRSSYDVVGTNTSARLRVVVLARKLDDEYRKEQVLSLYLNDALFGRLTYGIEAAAQEYFGKTADKRAPKQEQLSMAESMVLIAMIRQPEPDANNPQGLPGYDPTDGAAAEQNSKNRFNEIRDSLVDLHYLTADDAKALTYPSGVKPYDPKARMAQFARPVAQVINHVLSELTSSPDSAFRGQTWRSIREGGYRIMTTIDPHAQSLVEASADAQKSGSVMSGQPANLAAAAVVVEPGTGRVLGYFGGSNGAGTDFAGVFNDEKGDPTGFGAHPPGSGFMVHTLAAALKAGYSLNSKWQWTPHDMPGRTGAQQIRNSSQCDPDVDPTNRTPRSGNCTLLDSMTTSLNVPYYGVTISVTPAKVLELARAVGIDSMWTDDHQRQDLKQVKDMGAVVPSKFDTTLGLGQYSVTVLDQANAMATYSAGGLRAQAHFVSKVLSKDKVVYGEVLPSAEQPRALPATAIADLDYALARNKSAHVTGRDSAGSTGSWEFATRVHENADAWMVGYTGNLAMAVWIGDSTGKQPIKDAAGRVVWGSGLPATIYRNVMNSLHDDSTYRRQVPFPAPTFAGTLNPPGSVPS